VENGVYTCRRYGPCEPRFLLRSYCSDPKCACQFWFRPRGTGTIILAEIPNDTFRATSEHNYEAIKAADPEEGKPFQQFFFRVADDTRIPVTDYFIDFHVLRQDNSVDADLTKLFDRTFDADVYTHSVDAACRIMMIDCVGQTSPKYGFF
jgi:hypothetical protein